ncbi:MAG: hypothetical protein RR063_11590 [Anaerovoracaceae bacterium]
MKEMKKRRFFITDSELKNIVTAVMNGENEDQLDSVIAITFQDETCIISHPRLSDTTKDIRQYLIIN